MCTICSKDPRVEGLLLKHRLSSDVADRCCSDEHVFLISHKQFIDNWQMVAARLGLTQTNFTAINECGKDVDFKTFRALEIWRLETTDYEPTYRVLLRALLDSGENKAANKVCGLNF